VALPADARTRERLEWLADEIIEANGEATLWVGHLASAAQERELAARMAEAVAEDYRRVIDEAETAASDPDAVRRRTLGRLRRELRRLSQRDHFPPHERAAARQAVDELSHAMEATA
jgi:hypothetical protein